MTSLLDEIQKVLTKNLANIFLMKRHVTCNNENRDDTKILTIIRKKNANNILNVHRNVKQLTRWKASEKTGHKDENFKDNI